MFTDEQGKHETKSVINGVFNAKNNQIIFRETTKLITKSKKSFNKLCYLNASINIELNPKISSIKGVYTETTIAGERCNNGTININKLS